MVLLVLGEMVGQKLRMNNPHRINISKSWYDWALRRQPTTLFGTSRKELLFCERQSCRAWKSSVIWFPTCWKLSRLRLPDARTSQQAGIDLAASASNLLLWHPSAKILRNWRREILNTNLSLAFCQPESNGCISNLQSIANLSHDSLIQLQT
jgi:hypothetical protein